MPLSITQQARLRLLTLIITGCAAIPAPADETRSVLAPLRAPLTDPTPVELDELALDDSTLEFSPTNNEIATTTRVLTSAPSENELLQQRFPNGSIHIERYVAEDAEANLVNHGLYKEYDARGGIVRSGHYEMGRKQGEWSQVISAEAVKQLASGLDSAFKAPFLSKAEFSDDRLHGDWVITDSNGRPVLLWQFRDDRLENVSTWFDAKGQVTREINYVAGVPHGHAILASSNPKEPNAVEFHQGRIVKTHTEWYDGAKKTKKKAEESVLVPAGNYATTHDWWNSTYQADSNADASSIRHGAISTWHASGQLSMQGSYKMGEPDGEFKWWYSNGQLQGQGSYVQGAMTGSWIWWHTNGMKMVTGAFDNDVRTGLWSRWDESGRIVYRVPAQEIPATESELDSDDDSHYEGEVKVTDLRDSEPLRMTRLPSMQLNSAY